MFITALTIRRLIRELNPPLVSVYDPKIPDTECKLDQGQEIQTKQYALSDRYIEGACFDLSLDRIEVKKNKTDTAIIGTEKRLTPETKPLPFRDGTTWELVPGKSYQLISNEFINCPDWLMPVVHSRMTILQSQAITQFTFVKPGYSGTICGELVVVEGKLNISQGSRFCSVAFGLFASDDYVKLHQHSSAGRFGSINISKETDPYKGKRGGKTHGTQGVTWNAF